jgi:uncharacterized membrane protein
MTLLILGLLLWSFVHSFKRLAPAGRAAMQNKMGDASKGLIAILLVLSVVLMVMGYRSANVDFLWGRSAATTGINNLLMLFSVALFGLGSSKSRLRKKMRHPMLTGVVVWSASHLLVNGDTASIVLFGGLAIWALAEMVLINQAEPDYTPYDGGSVAGDIRLGVITLVVYGILAAIHTWLGYFPFGG